jgi:hypothetical protein
MGHMKDYKQLIKELPSNTFVCALGEFNPPTTAHELLVKTVKVVAEQYRADHSIYISPSDLISEDKKAQFLQLMFPRAKFHSLGETFFTSTIKQLTEKYRKVIIVAGADQFAEFKKLKESAKVEIISIGTKDPEINDAKMRQFASKGVYEDFKTLLPSTIREIDGKRLMNEMRIGMNLEPIKEQLVLVKDKLREKYFKGQIFNEGELVESNDKLYTIVKRGANHLLLKEESGELVSKWIHDVKPVKQNIKLEEAVIQPNGTDKIDVNAPESDTGAKQSPAPKGTKKGFLTFYNMDTKENGDAMQEEVMVSSKSNDPIQKAKTKAALILKQTKETGALKTKHEREKRSLSQEETQNQQGSLKDACWKGYTAIGMKNKNGKKVPNCVPVKEDLDEQQDDRKKQLKPFKAHTEKMQKPEGGAIHEPTQSLPASQRPFDPFFKEEKDFDLTEEEINRMVDSVTDEEIFDLYEEHEISLVYEDTGEEVEAHPEEYKMDLMEVLSRQERLKGKIRLRKTAAKRSRSTKIALKRYSPTSTINKRARRLAIKLMKKRLLRGRDPAKVSVGEKERIERMMAKRKDIINRLAQKLVARVRKIEKTRMSHDKVTKSSTPSVF